MLGVPNHKELLTTAIMEMATARLWMTLQLRLVCLGERPLHTKEVTPAQRKHGSRGKHLEQMV